MSYDVGDALLVECAAIAEFVEDEDIIRCIYNPGSFGGMISLRR